MLLTKLLVLLVQHIRIDTVKFVVILERLTSIHGLLFLWWFSGMLICSFANNRQPLGTKYHVSGKETVVRVAFQQEPNGFFIGRVMAFFAGCYDGWKRSQ
jgi:hypothetical protein